MRWQMYALIRAVINPLPIKVRRRLQDFRGRSQLDIKMDYRAKHRFIKAIQDQGLPIAGKTFLEIGTGWHPVFPLLLSLCGAEKIVGMDLHPWLNRRSYIESLQALISIVDRFPADLGLSEEMCRAKLAEWMALAESDTPLDQVLAAARLRYDAPMDACATPYPDGSFDYLVSSNVFEHIPPPVLEGIMQESKRILADGGMHLHLVNPADHFCMVDPRVSTVNFLKFSPRTWGLISGWGVGYHNRLRAVEFGRMLRAQGLEVTHEEVIVDARALKLLEEGAVKPHPSYRAYTNEQLAGQAVFVFARNQPARSGSLVTR